MAERGGKRENAGRKPKADEIKIIEAMDAVLVPKIAWEKLAGLVKDGDVQAIRIWLAYRYGQPKQSIAHEAGGEGFLINIKPK
jgi:hypothetical protein